MVEADIPWFVFLSSSLCSWGQSFSIWGRLKPSERSVEGDSRPQIVPKWARPFIMPRPSMASHLWVGSTPTGSGFPTTNAASSGCNPQPPPKVALKFMHVLHCPQVHSLVLHRSPQPLHGHVVYPAPLAVHADPDISGLQRFNPRASRKLASLIRVKDLRNTTRPPLRIPQRLHAKAAIQCRGYFPQNHSACFPVHYGTQIRKSPFHWNIRNVRAPHFICSGTGGVAPLNRRLTAENPPGSGDALVTQHMGV